MNAHIHQREHDEEENNMSFASCGESHGAVVAYVKQNTKDIDALWNAHRESIGKIDKLSETVTLKIGEMKGSQRTWAVVQAILTLGLALLAILYKY
jgi:hypothetical protein